MNKIHYRASFKARRRNYISRKNSPDLRFSVHSQFSINLQFVAGTALSISLGTFVSQSIRLRDIVWRNKRPYAPEISYGWSDSVRGTRNLDKSSEKSIPGETSIKGSNSGIFSRFYIESACSLNKEGKKKKKRKKACESVLNSDTLNGASLG